MSYPNVINAEVFLSQDCQRILRNKFVLFLGDSVIRGMYKDLVKLLQTSEYLKDHQLKTKGEYEFEGDTLLEGGVKAGLSNNTDYTEVREYKTPNYLVRFYFITRCYSDYLISICEDIKAESEKPDVVIMNSGVWDITRYGADSIYQYKQNLPIGIYNIIKCLPAWTLFLWLTTMPISRHVSGGFMVPEAECHRSKLREDILEANKYACAVMDEFKLDLLDLHFYFHNQIHRRTKDGIHWDVTAHRRITNLILHHICEAWELDIPGRIMVKQHMNEFKENIQDKVYADAFSDSEEPPAKRIALNPSTNRIRGDGLLGDPQQQVHPVPLLSLQPVFNPSLINNRKPSRDF